jgi:hypothetical protein
MPKVPKIALNRIAFDVPRASLPVYYAAPFFFFFLKPNT